MNTETPRLRRWLSRARPPRAAVTRALAAGLLASVTGVALFVGAVALLVVSADRPGLRAVAGVLIAIELFAFLRSPIRFGERLSGHRLGLSAVTQWRRWVVLTVGAWPYARWRRYASGDLLERALRDTDELQDLWLRGVLPLVTAALTMALGDVVMGTLPARGSFAVDAVALALLQIAGAAALASRVPALVSADREVRHARAAYQSTLVELSAAAPELLLLGAVDFVEARSAAPVSRMRDAERMRRRRRAWSAAVPVLAALAGVATLAVRHPATSPVWQVVAALLALATFELLGAVRDALDTVVAVGAAAERLEELEDAPRAARRPWPEAPTLHAASLTIREGDRTLARDVSLTLAPGRRLGVTGPSGTGKSALLRVLAALDAPDAGNVTVGDVNLDELDEVEIRHHLAYLASEPGLLTGLVGDVMTLGRHPARDLYADLARVGLDVDASTRWEALSRGERQRAALVRALGVSPDVAVLDEPTSGLGTDETTNVLRLLDDVGASVVVATHDPLVLAWCDEVHELRGGALARLSR